MLNLIYIYTINCTIMFYFLFSKIRTYVTIWHTQITNTHMIVKNMIRLNFSITFI